MAGSDTATSSDKAKLGRLKSLGPKEVWQVALYLPNRWEDVRSPTINFNNLPAPGDTLCVRGQLAGSVNLTFRNSVPRLSGAIIDAEGQTLRFSAFGDTRVLEAQLVENASDLVLLGRFDTYKDSLWLNDFEVVDKRWWGRLRPVYAGKPKVINADTTRFRIVSNLREALPIAAVKLLEELGMSEKEAMDFCGNPPFPSLYDLLLRAHLPRAQEEGEMAQEALELLAAYRAVQVVRKQSEERLSGDSVPRLHRPLPEWVPWSNLLPFRLSDNQAVAIQEIVDDMNSGRSMRRLLTGDVGYGKTAVFATVAAAAYAAGGRIAMLFPNETLASQAHDEILGWWPVLREDMAMVTGGTDLKLDLLSKRWLIGTTALLHREVGQFELVVVDEQQKMSREQREHLVCPETHLLEATATCIPRSQALVQFGGMGITMLTQAPVQKDIRTQFRRAGDRLQLFNDVKNTLFDGDQVLFVYPRKAKGETSVDDGYRSSASGSNAEPISDVEMSWQAWNKLFPGRVRMAHGSRKDEENQRAMDDMRSGHASILIATTVVEVGVNIPRLRRVVIVDPQTYGLSMLHQIRGRVARHGGVGHCDLFILNEPKNPRSLERLGIMIDTQDGFEIARRDLLMRGCGDLDVAGSRQTGADDTILFGRPLLPQRLEQVIARVDLNL